VKFSISLYALTALCVVMMVPFHQQLSHPLFGWMVHCAGGLQLYRGSSEPRCRDGSLPRLPDLMPSVSFTHASAMYRRGKLPGWPQMYLPM
jgi:hypothetical protein